MKIQLPRHKAAFSLIETVIAISVIAMVLLFSVTLGSVSLRNMVIKAQTVQATSIARSNIEKVRNMRDNVWLDSPTNCGDEKWDCWVNSDGVKVSIGTPYYIGAGQNYLTAQTAGTGLVKLAYGDNSSVVYTTTITIRDVTDFGTDAFKITSDQPDGTETAVELADTKIHLVESKVSWQSYGREYQVVLRTYLSDWLPRF